jgi:hypothetical protein
MRSGYGFGYTRRGRFRPARTLTRQTARKMKLNIYTVTLSTRRPFRWRTLSILVVLLFLGNLAAIPLLRATNMPIEPVWYWGLYTVVSAVLIGASLRLANRTGLGAPLIEGQLEREKTWDWARSVLAVALLVAIAGSLIVLPMSLNADRDRYPASWQLILASIKAGVMEEIFMRLLLMTFFVWLASFVSRGSGARPTAIAFWAAIILCGLLFGGSHVESRLSIPGITSGDMAVLMTVNTFFGIILGWLFWKLGLECAMFAHFMIDAVASAIAVPAYLSRNPLFQIIVLVSLMLAGIWSLRVLARSETSHVQLPAASPFSSPGRRK